MAEAPNGTVQTPASPRIEAPASDWDASQARLQQVMDEAALAANAQRDLEAAGEDPSAPAEPEPTSADADEAELPDELEPPETKPREPRPEEPGQQSSTQEPKRYSRKDAQRLDEQLQSTTAELNQIRTQLAHYGATEQEAIRNLSTLTGADGTYDRLAARVLEGTATQQEREQVQNMAGWRKAVAPVYRVAQQQVWNAFGLDFTKLKELDGVTDQVFDELKATPNPAALLRRVFDLGVQSGQKQRQQEARRLEASNSALRTRTTAEKTQPVPATNGTPPTNTRGIDKLMGEAFKTGENGQLEINPEFDRKAAKGEYLGVDLTR